MRFSLVCAGLVASVRALTLNSPSASSYWVQFSTNTIAWSLGGSDPTVVTLRVVNSNSTLLNGAFPIAEYVQASLQTYAVTNVTLVVADGYVVQMVNSTNTSQVYAQSGLFSVRAAGTTPAAVSTSANSTSANGTHASSSTSGRSNSASSLGSNNSTLGKSMASSGADGLRVLPQLAAAALVVSLVGLWMN